MASQSFLSAPSKATKSVEFEKAFLRFIGNNYDDTPSRYAEAVKEFSTLRESTVVKSPDKHETGLDLITRLVIVFIVLRYRSLKLQWSNVYSEKFIYQDKVQCW